MQKFLFLLSALAVLVLWGCAASVYVSPARFGGVLAVVGLCFPFCVALVVGAALLCLLLKPRLLWVHAVGLIGCAGTLRDYCPVNIPSAAPKGCLHVISYNTKCWNSWALDERGDMAVARYVCSQRPDLACLQETKLYADADKAKIKTMARRYGLHFESVDLAAENAVSLLSRFPIVSKEVVCRSRTNGAAAFRVVPRRGDTLLVVNVHLESQHLSPESRTRFHQIVKNPEEMETIGGKRAIVSTIARSGRERAQQADTLAAFLDRHAGEKILLMGDFNDTPVSYAHHQVCSRLTDVFRATGNGIGRSFHQDAIYVRIDHAFCSPHWKPFAAQVDNTVPFSDHYPLSFRLKEL